MIPQGLDALPVVWDACVHAIHETAPLALVVAFGFWAIARGLIGGGDE